MPVIQPKQQIWREPQQIELPAEFKTSFTLPDLVLQTVYRRGIQNSGDLNAFLDFRKYSPASPYDLPDMERAIHRTIKAIKGREIIGVWGDFDVDGQTATAVLVSALRSIGANVVYHIPVRSRESHGVQLEKLKDFLKQGVNLIITCDTGISANDPIVYAQNSGVDVIITDHHSLPEVLPPAFAVINPQMLEPMHKLRSLPGVGAAYKFAEALLLETNRAEHTNSLHDLAALGIIADIAEIRGDARYLVQSGIDRIRNSSRPSIRAMLDGAEINHEQLTEEHISFSLAPRLNAIGRLSDANPMVEFLLSEDPALLSVTVNQLEGLNARRKLLCDQVFQGALAQIERDPALLDHPVLMLSHPEWPAGVVGIAASRLTAIFHRPVILFVAPQDEKMRGSARSIEGINITSAIAQQQEHISTFGGHPMAAGLSFNPQNFMQFQRGINRSVEQMMVNNPVIQELEIDAFLQPSSLELEDIQSIELLAPFGAGNPPLTFAAREMRLVGSTLVGKTKEHLQISVEDTNGNESKLIWWQGAGFPQPDGVFDLAYTARTSNYRGQLQVQVEWLDYRVNESCLSISSVQKQTNLANHDHRIAKLPQEVLLRIIREHKPQIWREGTDFYSVTGSPRNDLISSENLVVWTVPPSQLILDELLYSATPSQIFWFGVIPAENDPAFFLKNIAKIIKNRLVKQETSFNIDQLARSSATTTTAVIQAVRWLAARGDISILEEDADHLRLELGGLRNEVLGYEMKTRLQKTLTEIKSYRDYYLRVDVNNLIQIR